LALLSVKQNAKFWGFSESWVYRNWRELQGFKISSRIRFDIEEQKELKKTFKKNFQKSLTIPPSFNTLALGGNKMASKLKARLRLPYGSIYKRKDCDSWSIDYKTRDGKRVQKVAKGAITAEDALKELQKAVGIKVGSEPVTFEQYSAVYLETYAKVRKRSWKTDEIYLNTRLIPFFGTMLLSEIRNQHVREFISKRLREGDKKSTINRYTKTLKTMMNLCKKDLGEPEVNPVSSDDIFDESQYRRYRVMTYEEEEKLMREAALHLKRLIQFCLQTGCRRQAVLGLEFRDLDFETETITIRPEINKSGRRDIIPMNGAVKKLLLEQVKRYKGKTEYLFPYEDETTGEVRGLKDFKRAWVNACRRANITGLQFRDLRRTYASRLHEKGIDPLLIQRLLRHSSFRISEQVYIQSSMRMMKEAVEKLNDNSDSGDVRVTWNKNKKKLNYVKLPFSAN